jgi:MFS family permease
MTCRGKIHQAIFVLVFCQFVTAFSALGIPPFFPLFLEKAFHSQNDNPQAFFAGVLFVLPTFFSAITSPIWGNISDRFGKKALLIRAQIGLSLSFLVAGFSTTPLQFIVALILQGILGGTFSASKAYLATLVNGESFRHSLTLMEAAPRAALVISPLIMGALMKAESPLLIYRYLAVLPLFSAALTAGLPSDKRQLGPNKTEPILTSHIKQNILVNPVSPHVVLALQFLFGLASVIASPYFSHTMRIKFPYLSTAQIGLLFGLPHFIYLACAGPLSTKIHKSRFVETLIVTFIMQSIALIGQGLSETLWQILLWRLLMGLSMTTSFICIHGLISNVTLPSQAGGLFGWLESSIKFSVVFGGILASFGYSQFGSRSLFFISAAAFIAPSIFLLYRTWFISKERGQHETSSTVIN